MKINIAKIVLSAAAAVVIAGCSSVNTVEPAAPSGVKQMVADKRVITDDGLDDIAYVAGVNQARTPIGLLKIQVELVNRTEAMRNVNYCFEWFDKDGMLINTPSPIWLTTSIDAGEGKYLSAVAPSMQASDFKLKLLGNVREY